MHFLQHLISYMVPINLWLDNEQTVLPPGFSYVIDNNDNFVVTSSGDNVIAKSG